MRVNILVPGKMILLPANEPKSLIDQPKSVLSMHRKPEQNFQVELAQYIESKIKLMSTFSKQGLLIGLETSF